MAGGVSLPGAKKAGRTGNPFAENEEPVIPGATGLVGEQDEDYDMDFSDTTTGFKLISEGRHAFQVVDWQKGPNKSNTGERFECQLRCLDGQETGQETKTWMSLSPNAMWKLCQFLEALGLAKAGEKARFKKSQVLWQPIEADIEHQEYETEDAQGKPITRKSASVGTFYPPTEATIKRCQEYVASKQKAPGIS